jgi:cytochrome c oxidase subunit II
VFLPRRRLSKKIARLLLISASVVCVAGVLVRNAVASSARATARQSVEPRVIEITAKRFAFDPARIEVRQGEPLRLLVKSADGPHGFSIEALKIDKEIDRGGKPVTIDFTPKDVGEFEILCSVDCGRGHTNMAGTLVVVARPAEAPR